MVAEAGTAPCTGVPSGDVSLSDLTPPEEQPGEYGIGDRTFLVADVEPMDVDGLRTVLLGTALWAVAFVVLLVFFREELRADGHIWWLWTCVCGVLLGFFGAWHSRWRRHRRVGYRG